MGIADRRAFFAAVLFSVLVATLMLSMTSAAVPTTGRSHVPLPSNQGGPTVVALRTTDWGAFTLSIPTGWKIKPLPATSDYRNIFLIKSPDGTSFIRISQDVLSTLFAPPSPESYIDQRLAVATRHLKGLRTVQRYDFPELNKFGVHSEYNGMSVAYQEASELSQGGGKRHQYSFTTRSGIGFLNLSLDFRDGAISEKMAMGICKSLSVKPEGGSAQKYSDDGDRLYGEGRLLDAIAAWSKAISLDRNLNQVYYNMGKALFDLGKNDEAINMFTAFEKREPEDSDVLTLIAACMIRKRDYGAAFTYFDRFCSLVPENSNFKKWRRLAGVMKSGANSEVEKLTYAGHLDFYALMDEEAKSSFDKALRLSPGNPEIEKGLANCLFRQKKWKQAALLYRVVLGKGFEVDDTRVRLESCEERDR